MTVTSVRLGGTVITNPSAPVWPDEGLTKLDLAQFYARISSDVLPWMRCRAVTMEGCPEEVRQPCVDRAPAPDRLPDGIPRARSPVPLPGGDADCIVGGTRKTLLALVNLGCIAMHVTHSRLDQFDRPDWISFDLDPADAFGSAARVAPLLRAQLEDHGLEGYVKTSGGRGLHVLVPLRRGASDAQVRAYAVRIAGEVAARHPRLVTVESRLASRKAPVHLNVSRNGSGQTIVTPFSVRWRPGAPVSMPLEWDEISPRLDPRIFTIRTAERRMAARSPWSSFFGHRQTLPRD